MPIIDENDLRAGLRALTATPPPAPEGREVRSVSRARHIQVRRIATGVLAVAVLAAPTGMLVTRALERGRGIAPVSQWEDRRSQEYAELARTAVAAWERTEALAPGESVRWLYANEIAEASEIVAVFATCDSDRCSRVALAHTPTAVARQQMESPEKAGAWDVRTYAVTDDDKPPVPAAYLTGQFGPDGPGNVLFVLAPPGADTAEWTSPAVRPNTGGLGELALREGAFVGDVGYLSAQATVTVLGDGKVLHAGPVGSDDVASQVPGTRWVAEVEDAPVMGVVPFEHREQLRRRAGRTHLTPERAAQHNVYVRCAGSAQMRVTLGTKVGTVACDGLDHEAVTAVLPAGKETALTWESGDPYTAYSLIVIVPGDASPPNG